MNFTGLSEFLWFLLLFGAMFAFTVWRQQRDRRRREERMAAMSAPVEFEPGPLAPPVPLPEGPEAAPDISWGRGPAEPVPPPEIASDWSEAPARPEAAAVPPWTPPAATRAPRRAAPVVRRPAATSRAFAPLRSEAGLRQAMIALTVLGPCRALDPYGPQEPRQEPGGGGSARIRSEGR